jgi:hypothetical protein
MLRVGFVGWPLAAERMPYTSLNTAAFDGHSLYRL